MDIALNAFSISGNRVLLIVAEKPVVGSGGASGLDGRADWLGLPPL